VLSRSLPRGPRGRRRARVGLILAAVALAAPGHAHAQAPASLNGEVLSQHTPYFGPTAGNCTVDPATGETTYTMDFAGRAAGPYPGTFTHQITARVGPQTTVLPMGPFPDGFSPGGQNPSQLVPAGQLLSVAGSFTIDSPSGDVHGTTTLSAVVPADSTHAGTCREWSNTPVPGFGTVTGSYEDVRAFGSDYEAVIGPGRASVDRGTTDLQARQGNGSNQGGVIFNVNDLGQRFASTGLPAPRVGRTANAEVVSGKVFIRRPGGSFVRLTGERQIPIGSEVDTRAGRVRLTTAAGGGRTQQAEFYDGVFRLLQAPSRRPVTELRLSGKLVGCGPGPARAAAASGKGRRLWGDGRGRFRTRGRRSAATITGTIWLVADRCDRTTLTRVRRGRVSVRDFAARRTVTLRAGQSYVAGRR
jgi:hypothetical protein